MEELQVNGVILVAIITGLVQLIKQTGLNKKIIPFIAVVFGISGGVFYVYPGDIKAGVLVGLALGLTSVGLYSGTKNTLGK